MKRFLSSFIAAIALSAPAAFAADMPVKAPVPVVAVYNWSGWYWGVNAGGNWGTSNSTMAADLVGGGFFGTVCRGPVFPCFVNVEDVSNAGGQSFRTKGFTGGVLAGYNWQSGNLLIGAEADFEYFRSAGSSSKTVTPLAGGTVASSIANVSMSTDWLFTLRPRVGLVQNNWLVYATGGLAVTQLKASWNWRETVFGNTESASASATKAGWIVGAGFETVLPQNWTIGAEYLYVKFGSVSTTTTPILALGGGAPAERFQHSADLRSNIVRVRLTNKF